MLPTTGAPAVVPPISPYGTLQGTLFCYHNNLAAFESVPIHSKDLPKKKCILVGGLSDGLLPTPYTKDLEAECHRLGWSFVNPILSSSYLGFGNGDLDRDTEEISALMWYLSCHRGGEIFALVGHSTGCQNGVHFCKHGQPAMVEKTKVVALQAPVSDREGAMLEPKYKEMIELASKMKKEGRQEEMMPREAFWAPITAQRFLDLQQKGGRDDFFSSDFTDEELLEKLGHMSNHKRHVIVAFSGSDEFVPKHVDPKSLSKRLCKAINNGMDSGVAYELFLSTGNHNLSKGDGDKEKFTKTVGECLESA